MTQHIAEMAVVDEFDRAVAAGKEALADLARQALAEHRAGLTQGLDPDTL